MYNNSVFSQANSFGKVAQYVQVYRIYSGSNFLWGGGGGIILEPVTHSIREVTSLLPRPRGRIETFLSSDTACVRG